MFWAINWTVHRSRTAPIEPLIVPLAALDPIDLGRIMVLLKVDLAAMMGYSGAVYEQFFGTLRGIVVALAALMVWVALPSLFAFRAFRREDL